MGRGERQIIIAYNDEWEQYQIIFRCNGINCPNALQLFQAALEADPNAYEDLDNETVWVLDLDTKRVETATITKTIKVELEF